MASNHLQDLSNYPLGTGETMQNHLGPEFRVPAGWQQHQKEAQFLARDNAQTFIPDIRHHQFQYKITDYDSGFGDNQYAAPSYHSSGAYPQYQQQQQAQQQFQQQHLQQYHPAGMYSPGQFGAQHYPASPSAFNHAALSQDVEMPTMPTYQWQDHHSNRFDLQVPDLEFDTPPPADHLLARSTFTSSPSMYSEYTIDTDHNNQTSTNDDDSNKTGEPCYADLLYDCLMTAPNHARTLRDIYTWVCQHSERARTSPSRGWQNSVRHNLSMNAAFERVVSAECGETEKKTSLWRLTDHAIEVGIKSTTRYRKDTRRKGGRKTLRRTNAKHAESGAKGGEATKRAGGRRLGGLAQYPAQQQLQLQRQMQLQHQLQQQFRQEMQRQSTPLMLEVSSFDGLSTPGDAPMPLGHVDAYAGPGDFGHSGTGMSAVDSGATWPDDVFSSLFPELVQYVEPQACGQQVG